MGATVRILSVTLFLLVTGCARHGLPGDVFHPVGDSTTTYTVQRGDTLYSISKKFGIDHAMLARQNYIRWPYTIYVGQHLSISRPAIKSGYMPLPVDKAEKRKATKTAKRPDHSSRAYSKPAVNAHSVKLRWPVEGKLLNRFGRRGSRMHDGIDVAAGEGTPVYAAAAGEVVYADQRLAGYGKLIIVRHSRDMFTAYAHNQQNLVNRGDKVKAGDMIARVGKTGRASQPHLHFEVRRGSTPVDPLLYLPRR